MGSRTKGRRDKAGAGSRTKGWKKEKIVTGCSSEMEELKKPKKHGEQDRATKRVKRNSGQQGTGGKNQL